MAGNSNEPGRTVRKHLPARSHAARAAVRGEAGDAARAGAVRRGGPGIVAAHDRAPGCRRQPRGGLRGEEARTLVGPVDLEGDLHRTRAHGFALAEGELQPGSGAVAVPVFDIHGRSIAAIEVEVTPGRAAVELAVPALLMAARCLRREITPAVHVRRGDDPHDRTGVRAPVRMQA